MHASVQCGKTPPWQTGANSKVSRLAPRSLTCRRPMKGSTTNDCGEHAKALALALTPSSGLYKPTVCRGTFRLIP
eukprot:12921419-Prorocentrum_lima.AAC.1